MVQLYSYQAGAGDFFLLRFGENPTHNFIIDGGDSTCKIKFKKLLSEIKQRGEQVDALLLTHFDNDHIMGMLKGLQIAYDEDVLPTIARIYMNTGRGIINYQKSINEYFPEDDITVEPSTTLCSVKGEIKLLDLFSMLGIKKELCNYVSTNTSTIEFCNCVCKIISPTPEVLTDIVSKKWMNEISYISSVKCAQTISSQRDLSDLIGCELPQEDNSLSNRASIAFVFEYDNVRIAFLGDAAPTICLQGLERFGFTASNPYNIDLVKISHHGSQHNYSDDLYKTLSTSNYLLSTDGRAGRLPDKIVLAKLLKIAGDGKIRLCCNYNLWEMPGYLYYFSENDNKLYGNRLKSFYLNERFQRIKIKDGFELNAAR